MTFLPSPFLGDFLCGLCRNHRHNETMMFNKLQTARFDLLCWKSLAAENAAKHLRETLMEGIYEVQQNKITF